MGQSAFADITTNTRLHGGNAWNYCHTADNSPDYWAKGMVWLSNNESDYYSEAVTVAANTNSVSVSIRGAANSCNTTFDGNTDMWAVNVSTSFLSGLSGNSFHRGVMPANATFAWTSAGGKLYGNLNVSSVALCSAAVGGVSQQTISIGITRQQRQTRPGFDWTSLVIGTEWVPVTVTRTCPPWSTSATTTRTVNGANTGTGTLGQVIRWEHGLNLLQNSNPVPIYSQTFSTGFTNGWNGVANGATTPAWRPVGVLRTIASSAANRTQHTITQADVGNSLCQQLQWDPTNSSGGRDGRSPNLCVTVPHNYSLTPTISSPSSNTVIESDSRTIPVTGRVTNDGPTKSRTNVNWRLSQLKWSPTATPSAPNPTDVGGTGADVCTYFTGEIAGSCTDLSSGTEANGYGFGTPTHAINNPADSQTYPGTGTIADDPPGTKICYVMSIQPYSHAASDWRHSRLHCLIIGKKPKVQVWGGGIQVGRVFSGTSNSTARVEGDTITKVADGLTYGSWAEYGVLATGPVQRFASGSGLNLTNGGHSSAAQTDWSPYTFTRNGPNYGNYTASGTAFPDITTVFPYASAVQEPNFNISTTAKGRSIRPAAGAPRNLTITATPAVPTLTSGQWLVVNATGHNITIGNDLRYANGPYTNAGQIPQLVIIADNITINSNVTQVDAWLLARNGPGAGAYGAIATCDQQAGASGANGVAQWLATPSGSGTNYTASNNSRLTLSHCTQPLRINGPVIANQLYLRRTAGSGAGPDAATPAEIINLRPDAYLWARERTRSTLIFQTITETELPPRY